VILSPTPALEHAPPEGGRSVLRRLVLQIDLRSVALPVTTLPLRFGWEAWRDERAAAHAAVLYEGFRDGVDAAHMPALSTLEGCHDLLTATSHHHSFVPEATWMAVQYDPRDVSHPVSTIQVIGSPYRAARIQNLSVIPDVRGRGIARATLMRCLRSCRSLGYDLVELEVTATNAPAVELYRSVGFALRRSYLHEAGR
jgi:ribosomal protein S18 acetylase RimI-like enzyme